MQTGKGKERVSCDLCGHAEYNFITKQTDLIHKTTDEIFEVVKCRKCGLIFTNPRPNKESIGRYYSDKYTFHKDKSLTKKVINHALNRLVNNSFIRSISPLFPGKINRILIQLLKPNIPDPVLVYLNQDITSQKEISFLDIGCGSGSNANFWGTASSLLSLCKTIKVIGIEISDDARNVLSSNNIKSYKTIDEISSLNKFDIIRLNWSLEHVHSPSKYFEFINSNLSKDGIAIICVPNNDGLIYKINKSCLELPIHLFHYDIRSLTKFAEKYQLTISEYKTFSYPAMYAFAEDISLIPQKYNFSKMSLNKAFEFMQTHMILDDIGFGNDLMVILRKKGKN